MRSARRRMRNRKPRCLSTWLARLTAYMWESAERCATPPVRHASFAVDNDGLTTNVMTLGSAKGSEMLRYANKFWPHARWCCQISQVRLRSNTSEGHKRIRLVA